MNGKQGKMAIFVKSSVRNSANLMKVMTLKRLMTSEEKFDNNISFFKEVWLVDAELVWYDEFDRPNSKMPFVPDECIKLLPDLEEDEELIEAKELEKENG